MSDTVERAKLIWLLTEYQKAIGIIVGARQQLHREGAMDAKGARLISLTQQEIRRLEKAFEDGKNHLKGLTP